MPVEIHLPNSYSIILGLIFLAVTSEDILEIVQLPIKVNLNYRQSHVFTSS